MSCKDTQSKLVSYHFGAIEDEERLEVEEHLRSCQDCLEGFFTLKRSIETADCQPLPPDGLLDRLRASVRDELGLARPRPWLWWERPLAFGFAGVATLVAMAAVTAMSRVADQPRRMAPPSAVSLPAPHLPPSSKDRPSGE